MHGSVVGLVCCVLASADEAVDGVGEDAADGCFVC